jgi:hypothetical protein
MDKKIYKMIKRELKESYILKLFSGLGIIVIGLLCLIISTISSKTKMFMFSNNLKIDDMILTNNQLYNLMEMNMGLYVGIILLILGIIVLCNIDDIRRDIKILKFKYKHGKE